MRFRIVFEMESPNPKRVVAWYDELVCSVLNRHGQLTVYGQPVDVRQEYLNPTSEEWEQIK